MSNVLISPTMSCPSNHLNMFNLTKRIEQNDNKSDIVMDDLTYTGNTGSLNVNGGNSNNFTSYCRDVNNSCSSANSTENSTMCLDDSSDYKNQCLLEYDDTESEPSSICSSSLSETSGLSEEIPINTLEYNCHLKYINFYRPRIPLHRFLALTLNDCNNTISEDDNDYLIKNENDNTISMDMYSVTDDQYRKKYLELLSEDIKEFSDMFDGAFYSANNFIKREPEESECDYSFRAPDDDFLTEVKTEMNSDVELEMGNITPEYSTEEVRCIESSANLNLGKQNETSSELVQLENKEFGTDLNKTRKNCIASLNETDKATSGKFKKDFKLKSIQRKTRTSLKRLNDIINIDNNFTILKLRNRSIKRRKSITKEKNLCVKKTVPSNNKQKYIDKNKILDCEENINNCRPKTKKQKTVKKKKLKRKEPKTKDNKTNIKSTENNAQKENKTKTPVLKTKLKSNVQKIKQGKTCRKKPKKSKETKVKNKVPKTEKKAHPKKSENLKNNVLVTNKNATTMTTENFTSNISETNKTEKRTLPINESITLENDDDDDDEWQIFPKTIKESSISKKRSLDSDISDYPNKLIKIDASKMTPSFEEAIDKLVSLEINTQSKRKQELHDVKMKAVKGNNYLRSEKINSKHSNNSTSIKRKKSSISSYDIDDSSESDSEEIAYCCLESFSLYYPDDCNITDRSSGNKKFRSIYF